MRTKTAQEEETTMYTCHIRYDVGAHNHRYTNRMFLWLFDSEIIDREYIEREAERFLAKDGPASDNYELKEVEIILKHNVSSVIHKYNL